MNRFIELYWELYFGNYSTDRIMQDNNLLKDYLYELIDGPIADIGCGQSKFLLQLLDSDRDLYAIDEDQIQLDYLERRVFEKDKSKLKNWHFIKLDLRKGKIPENKYALIICSNILHFFNIKDNIRIKDSLVEYSSPGTLIYVKVHSERHPSNKSVDLNKDAYFKHFFTINDLNNIFSEPDFERIYVSETQSYNTKEEVDFLNNWLDKWFEINNVTDINVIKKEKENYLKDDNQAYITAIYRKI